jgi:hypothetical protein
MRRLFALSGLIPAVVLVALAVVPAATANKPIREVHASQPDMLTTDQCAFPVLGHVEGGEIITTFTDRAGNPIRQIGVFPGNTLTLTNLDTGKSITVVSTGSFHAQVEPDGSGFFMSTGPGPNLGNPITGEPGIWYQNGRLVVTFDADGNQTSVEFTGKLVNLCPQLAS